MTNKEQFLEIFHRTIHREGSDKLLEWLESSDFFDAPASTKFHGSYAGGLLEHSLNVYRRLCDRLVEDEEGGLDGKPHKSPSQETIAIAALFHDLCKVNVYKPSTKNVKIDGKWQTVPCYEREEKFPCGDHADKSIIILQNFMHLEPEEILAIRAHMGGFDSAAKGGSYVINDIFKISRLAVHLHLADMEATHLIEEE